MTSGQQLKWITTQASPKPVSSLLEIVACKDVCFSMCASYPASLAREDKRRNMGSPLQVVLESIVVFTYCVGHRAFREGEGGGGGRGDILLTTQKGNIPTSVDCSHTT